MRDRRRYKNPDTMNDGEWEKNRSSGESNSMTDKERKFVCCCKDDCPYEYDACYNPTLFCRILEHPSGSDKEIKRWNKQHDR